MSVKILENSSFGILRTNPKLTGNVKIVVDSSNNTFIESISANEELAKSKYKSVKTSSSSSYQFDLSRIFGNTPSDIFYDVKKPSSDYSVLDNYGAQYDLDYCYGSYSINSKAYTEEFGIFAPIWLEENMPDYFIIFKIEGPVSVNNKNATTENQNKNIVEDPANFKDLFLSNAKIIKTFDLTNNTNTGRYIRKYRNSQNFPTSSINFTTRNDQPTYWNGINIDVPGGFTSKAESIYKTFFVTDRTILENDFFVTGGFERNRLTAANILNLEFLFDDTEADSFTINRYFGLYVNAVDEGTFRVDGNKFYTRARADRQTRPETATTFSSNNENSHIITNSEGVKLYIDTDFTTSTYSIPAGSGLTANDFTIKYNDVSSLDSIFYVKDKKGNFYNLNYKKDWLTDEMRLQQTSIDLKDFTGFEETILTVKSKVQDKPSKASTFIEINSNPLLGDRYVVTLPKKQVYLIDVELANSGDTVTISDLSNTDSVTFILSSSDEDLALDDIKYNLSIANSSLFERYTYSIRGGKLLMAEKEYSGVDDDIQISLASGDTSIISCIKQVSADFSSSTIYANNTYTTTPGTAYQLSFNQSGTLNEVAQAMAAAINNIQDSLFEATAVGNKVIIIAKVAGRRFNDLIVGRDIFLTGNQTTLVTTEPAFSHPDFYLYKFQGGTENSKSKAIVDIDLFTTFQVPNRYLRTTSEKRTSETLSKVSSVFYYIDEEIRDVNGKLIGFNNFDKYCTVAINDSYSIFRDSMGSIYLYELYDIPFGRFSIFPMKTMDFNYLSTEYGNELELNTETSYYKHLFAPDGVTVATFTGRQRDGILTVTAVESGVIYPGQKLAGPAGLQDPTIIVANGTGTGGVGTYLVNDPTTIIGTTTFTSVVLNTHEDIEEFYSTIGGFTSLLGTLDSEVKFFIKGTQGKMESPNIESEYDRLKENTLVQTSVQSRTVPYISKWVYRNGKDCREKEYRLTASEAFGLTNFSPSSDEKNRNTNYFTHEWYYLQSVPSYYSILPIYSLDNVYSYFSEKIDVTSTGLLDINTDYFTEYFTVDYLVKPGLLDGTQPALPYLINIDYKDDSEYIRKVKKQFRYSLFEGANSQNFATTLFRGVKVIVKERVESNSIINYDISSIKTKYDTRYNGYKFSCVLIPHGGTYGGIKRKTIEYQFIENRKHKSITFLIYLKIDDILNRIRNTDSGTSFVNTIESDFIDRTILYALKSKINGIDNTQPVQYSDITLSGAINASRSSIGVPPNNLLPSKFLPGSGTSYLSGVIDATGQETLFTEEILINKNGSYNNIFITPLNTISKTYKISNVIDNNKLGIIDNPIDLPIPAFYSSLNELSVKNGTYTYINGGYNFWTNRLNKVSFGYIQNLVNQGDPSIKYTTVMEDGSIQNNLFIIELQTANFVMKSNYLRPIQVENKSNVTNDLSTLVGNTLEFAEEGDAKISPIYRHSGYYQPKFNNVIYFTDPYITDFNLSNLSREYLVKQKMRDKNTQIMITDDLGIIPNFYLHKVNDVNPASIVQLSTNSSELPVYPLSGQIAIDYKDFYTFKSNWDANYFEKYFERGTKEEKAGTRSVIEKRSFFGSKIMKIQDSITIEKLSAIKVNSEADLINIGNDINKPGNPYHIVYFEDTSKYIVDIYLDKKIVEVISNLGVYSFFDNYINPAYGFGSQDNITDDVNNYIQSNILPRYSLDEINLFVLKSGDVKLNLNFPAINSILSDSEKFASGYKVDKNVQFLPINGINNFNLRLIYNKTAGYQYSIAPSFRINKK